MDLAAPFPDLNIDSKYANSCELSGLKFGVDYATSLPRTYCKFYVLIHSREHNGFGCDGKEY
jgi:hypothetical protein